MTPHGVTDALVHTLVTTTHAEGIFDIDAAAAIEHRGQALLVASNDQLDPTPRLPAIAVLPGEHLLDALCRCLAGLGLHLNEVTGYLGHHDRVHPGGPVRQLCFSVTIIDPHTTRRLLTVSHEWADLDDPDGFPPSARPHLIKLSAHQAELHPSSTPPATSETSPW